MTSAAASDNRMKKLRTNYAPLDGWSSRKTPAFFLLTTVVLIIASLYWAQAVLIPIAVSILLTFLLTPVADSPGTTRSRTSLFRGIDRDPGIFIPRCCRLDYYASAYQCGQRAAHLQTEYQTKNRRHTWGR